MLSSTDSAKIHIACARQTNGKVNTHARTKSYHESVASCGVTDFSCHFRSSSHPSNQYDHGSTLSSSIHDRSLGFMGDFTDVSREGLEHLRPSTTAMSNDAATLFRNQQAYQQSRGHSKQLRASGLDSEGPACQADSKVYSKLESKRSTFSPTFPYNAAPSSSAAMMACELGEAYREILTHPLMDSNQEEKHGFDPTGRYEAHLNKSFRDQCLEHEADEHEADIRSVSTHEVCRCDLCGRLARLITVLEPCGHLACPRCCASGLSQVSLTPPQLHRCSRCQVQVNGITLRKCQESFHLRANYGRGEARGDHGCWKQMRNQKNDTTKKGQDGSQVGLQIGRILSQGLHSVVHSEMQLRKGKVDLIYSWTNTYQTFRTTGSTRMQFFA